MEQKENWIDFESKISSVIQGIGCEMEMEKAGENSFVKGLPTFTFLRKLLEEYDQIGQKRQKQREKKPFRQNAVNGITYRELISRLEDDLDKLICALEIYLAGFVKEINEEIYERIKGEKFKKNVNIEGFLCDCVLSFNYTDTYRQVYGERPDIEYDFIHGEAKIDNPTELNNMVLGIDEYLKGKQKNQDIKFISFKKYYQRIFKQTGCKYQEWLDDIKPEKPKSGQKDACWDEKNHKECAREKPEPHKLYIFGHSLDVTDKDILRKLILTDNVETTIFYYSKEDLGAKIANLVKVIGKNELIKRTGRRTKKITFWPQEKKIESDGI